MHVAVGVGGGLILHLVLIRTLENRFIFHPPGPWERLDPESASLDGPAELWLTASDRIRVNAVYLQAPGSERVLLWFHGNAENLPRVLPRLRYFARMGINVFSIDYRGYGRSAGSPDEKGVYRDADAAYRHLTETLGFKPQQIVIGGQSLGGAVAIDLASRRKCGGLVVESSFTSTIDMAFHLFRVPALARLGKSRFNSLAKIRSVRAPIFISHGKEDRTVPYEMGERLFAAAPEPKAFVALPGAGHTDITEVGGEVYWQQMKDFLVASTPASNLGG